MEKIIEQSLNYQGEVTLSIQNKKSGKVTKLIQYNHALGGLSRIFAYAMCGYNITTMIPSFLDLCYREMPAGVEDENYPPISMLLTPVLLTGTHYSADNNDKDSLGNYYYFAEYTALISGQNLNALSNNGNPLYLYLQNSSNEKLVELQLKDANENPLTSLDGIVGNGTNLVVSWKIKLCRNSSTE